MLTKKYCRELSKTITNVDLMWILVRARYEVTDWEKASRSNKGLSRGVNWNLFCKDFDVDEDYPPIRKYRILEEFGEYVPPSLRPEPIVKVNPNVTHQLPDFSKFGD